MNKIIGYLTIGALVLSLVSSCKKNDSTPTFLASVGKDTTAGSVNGGTLIKEIYVSGLSDNVHEVQVRFKGSDAYTTNMELYLKSPSGKILQLCYDEARDNTNNLSYPAIDLTFSDAATTSISSWTSSSTGNFSGTFKPRGSLAKGYYVAGTITTLAGFIGDSPNGTWILYASNDSGSVNLYFTSWELFLSTAK